MKLLATYLWLQSLSIKFQAFPPFPFSMCETDSENWRGKNELIEKRGKSVICQRPAYCTEILTELRIQYIWEHDSSLWRVYQERWMPNTLPNKAIYLIIKREQECLLPKEEG